MNVFLNSTAFHNVFKTRTHESNTFNNKSTTISFNSMINYSLSNTFSVDLSAYYFSSQASGFIHVKPFYTVDGVLRKTFLDNRLSLNLAFSDMFDWLQTSYTSDQEGTFLMTTYKQETQRLKFTIRYVFGKAQNAKRSKKSASDEAQKRIKEGYIKK